jgi:hypothetical protein
LRGDTLRAHSQELQPKEDSMASRRSPERPRPAERSPDASPARRAGGARKTTAPAPRVALTREARHAMIAESAYLRAERRGFAPGHETEDWLAAEAEVDALLKISLGGSSQ